MPLGTGNPGCAPGTGIGTQIAYRDRDGIRTARAASEAGPTTSGRRPVFLTDEREAIDSNPMFQVDSDRFLNLIK